MKKNILLILLSLTALIGFSQPSYRPTWVTNNAGNIVPVVQPAKIGINTGTTTLTNALTVVGSISITGTLTASNITATTYTPVITTTMAITVTPKSFIATRIGNLVHVTGWLTCNFGIESNPAFTLTIPIASTFTSTYDLNGTCNSPLNVASGLIYASITLASASISVVDLTPGDQQVVFDYIIK